MASDWIKHVMKHKKPGMSLGDAMKAAKKTWKKPHKGGQLMGKATGGTRKRHRGGQLYGFSGGPYVSSELSDGAGRFPPYNLADNQYVGNPSAMTAGRRRKTQRRRR